MLICDINVFFRYGRQLLEDKLKHLDIDMYGLITLLVIHDVPGITQTRLIPFLLGDKGNVTKKLQEIEKEGLIYRKVDEFDQRIKLCYLTENGALLIPALQSIMQTWEDMYFAGLTKEEIDLYNKISDKITNNIRKI